MTSKVPPAEMEHVKRLRQDASILNTLCSEDADPKEILVVLERMTGDTVYLQQYFERRTPPPTPRTLNPSSETPHQAIGRSEEFIPAVPSKEQFMEALGLSEQDYKDVTEAATFQIISSDILPVWEHISLPQKADWVTRVRRELVFGEHDASFITAESEFQASKNEKILDTFLGELASALCKEWIL